VGAECPSHALFKAYDSSVKVVSRVAVLLIACLPACTKVVVVGGVSATPTPSVVTTAPSVPDARSVPVESLTEASAKVDTIRYADLDGEPPEEIVILSSKVLEHPRGSDRVLQVFTWVQSTNAWVDVIRGHTFTGTDGQLFRPVFGAGNELFDGESHVGVLETVDFRRDGSPELVVGEVDTFGASGVAFSVWIFSLSSGGLTLEFEQPAKSGGFSTGADLVVGADGLSLLMTYPTYSRGDIHCCPSGERTDIIAYNPANDRIGVSSTVRSPTP
jgi:hypothetical protein